MIILGLIMGSGSPPPTWGIPFFHLLHLLLLRITPTYVGNTGEKMVYVKQLEDHPHLRGEYISISLLSASVKGSPPPTWGIHFLLFGLFHLLRITPTYVGNTQEE